MAIPASQFYKRNLAALSAFQPEVAVLVEAASIPEDVTEATGRDGSATLLLAGPDGRQEWFGGSSMPTISARELFASFPGDAAGVLLPGILTGLEVRVLSEKLPAFASVFVIEDHPLAIKLAMHLYAYEGLIEAGRLVFLTSGDLVGNLRRFFTAHPGYELPKHLLPVPHRSAAEMSELQRQIENAAEAVLQTQAEVVESAARALRNRSYGSLPEQPRVAVVSVDARSASIEQARRLGRAMTGLGWPHEICVPDAPDRCHVAARIQSIARLPADVVLLVNCGAGRLGPLLPRGLPVASWYVSLAGIAPTVAEDLVPGQVNFAASVSIKEALVQAGVPLDPIELCEIGADDTVYHPLDIASHVGHSPTYSPERDRDCGPSHDPEHDPSHPLHRWTQSVGGVKDEGAVNQNRDCQGAAIQSRDRQEAVSQSRDCQDAVGEGNEAKRQQGNDVPPVVPSDVAILADLPDDCPEALRLTLASHLALWWAMREMVADNIDEYQADNAMELLDSAQSRSGVTLQDEALRGQFLALLRTRIVPAQLGRAAARTLIADGHTVAIWGNNWRGQLDQADVWRGRIPGGEAVNRIFNAARVVVFPYLSTATLQSALDALASGAQVVCRRPDRPFDREYPGLTPLAPYLHFYSTGRDLRDAVRRLRRTDASLRAIMQDHTVARRLRTMIARLRSRQTAPGQAELPIG